MRTIVLDRDGVINEDSDSYIKSEDEFLPIPGSMDAIAALHQAGFRVTVATNQSGIGRGLFDEYALARIHQKLCHDAEIAGGLVEGIFYCPHTPADVCACRKPAIGLLEQIQEQFNVGLKGSYFIGDSDKDIDAALAFGLLPVLVRTGKGADTEAGLSAEKRRHIPVFSNLLEAVQQLVLK